MPLLKGDTRAPCCASPPLAMAGLSELAPAGSGPDVWGPAECVKGEATATVAACWPLLACACSGAVNSLCSWGAGLADAARCGSWLGARLSVRCKKNGSALGQKSAGCSTWQLMQTKALAPQGSSALLPTSDDPFSATSSSSSVAGDRSTMTTVTLSRLPRSTAARVSTVAATRAALCGGWRAM